jgi:hypothetical protein
METILEIRASHDGCRLVAWDPNGEQEVAEATIRTGQRGMPRDVAMAQAYRTLTNRIIDNREWFEGGM